MTSEKQNSKEVYEFTRYQSVENGSVIRKAPKREETNHTPHIKNFLKTHGFRYLNLLRLIFSVTCCILYILQTMDLPDRNYLYPPRCCGIAEHTTQPCRNDSYKLGTIGWAMRNSGCLHVNNIYIINKDGQSHYAMSRANKGKLSEPIASQQCRRYCNIGDPGCSNDVIDTCRCSIECGDTLYCGKVQCESWHYMKLIFYEKTLWLYILQVLFSLLTMFSAIIQAFSAHFIRRVRTFNLIEPNLFFDCLNGILALASLAYAPCLKDLYIPLFLECFTARMILKQLLYSIDLNNISSKFLTPVIQKTLAALLGLAAILFSFTCVVHYFERVGCPGDSHVTTLFDSIWFIIVTITTVGYGDKSPSTPLGKLSVIFLILIILFFLPKTLASILELINNSKQDYQSYHCRTPKRHVLLCVCKLDLTLIADFLNEFYSQEENIWFNTVVLTAEHVPPAVNILLKSPAWRNKVLVIIGSALKERDLERANIRLAKACFLLPDRITDDARMSDHETMLRASFIQNYAPHIDLYVHIFMAENRMNVNFAKQVLCEGRLKQALMANNCIYPGLSSLLTILMHTTSSAKCGNYKDHSQLYNSCSAMEVYAIILKDSLLFRALAGRTFLCASIFIQRTTEVLVIAVKPADTDQILLNPGRRHTLSGEDTIYYVATEKEENIYKSNHISNEDLQLNMELIMRPSSVKCRDSHYPIGIMEILDKSCTPLCPSLNSHPLNIATIDSTASLFTASSTPDIELAPRACKFRMNSETESPLKNEAKNVNQKPSAFTRQVSKILDNTKQTSQIKVLNTSGEEDINCFTDLLNKQESELTYISLNPRPTYFWVKETVRHICKEPPSLCCLQAGWKVICHEETVPVTSIQQPDEMVDRALFLTGYERPLIVCASESGSQLYEFLLPLRAYHIPTEELIPIVLLLPSIPDTAFLEAISSIPFIKFIVGRPESVDDLLIAGALDATGVILCLGDGVPEIKAEAHMSDASLISTAQNISQIFVNTKIYVELTEIWSMRYLKLENGRMSYTSSKEKNSNWTKPVARGAMDFIHAPYFVSSQAFAPSLLDTLLYQCLQKDYILELVHLFLGLRQTPGSGYIGKVSVTESDIQNFDTYGELILDLAVNNDQLALAIYRTIEVKCENEDTEVNQFSAPNLFLQRRAICLGLANDVFALNSAKNVENCHILVNPPADTPLMSRDIILVINTCSTEQYKIIHRSYSEIRRSSMYPISECSSIADSFSPEITDQSFKFINNSLHNRNSSRPKNGPKNRPQRPK
ncbi:Potassium channel subfamily member 2 isoform X1 [Oopsacas minuta]|uniref:Potassium channel subfamily member 2 isoform X1 n=1 Tax=Oopsacas minuta TaxID=111878 RepID=A0AAV7JFS7_9METZ|nr:Potassium channel subfamily member 2 isoform X1 [Oopsacas minuta]